MAVIHAVFYWRGRVYPAGTIRTFQYWADENALSSGIASPLWQHDAGDCRGAFQLFDAGQFLE